MIKRAIAGSLAILLSIAAPAIAQEPSSSESADELLAVAREALQELSSALPDPSVHSLLSLATWHISLGDRKQGLDMLHHAADSVDQLKPGDSPTARDLNLAAVAMIQARWRDREGATATIRKLTSAPLSGELIVQLCDLAQRTTLQSSASLSGELEPLVRHAEASYDRLDDQDKLRAEAPLIWLLAFAGDSERAFTHIDRVEASGGDVVFRNQRIGRALFMVVTSHTPFSDQPIGDPVQRRELERHVDEVERRLDRIPQISQQSMTLGLVASQRARIGDFEGSERVLTRILDDSPDPAREDRTVVEWAMTLSRICRIQFNSGQVEAARNRLRAAIDDLMARPDSNSRSGALAHLADAACEIGDLTNASRCLKSVDRRYRVSRLRSLAHACRKAGDATRAREALDLALDDARRFLDNPSLRQLPPQIADSAPSITPEQAAKAQALCDLALVQVARQEFEAAHTTAAGIEPASLRNRHLATIAESLAFSGQARSTLDWLRGLGYPAADGGPIQGLLRGTVRRLREPAVMPASESEP